MAPMGEVPDMTRQEVTIGTRHCGDILQPSFCRQEGGSTRPAGRYFRELSLWINVLRWSEPDLYQTSVLRHQTHLPANLGFFHVYRLSTVPAKNKA
jgi:hypothetical protein